MKRYKVGFVCGFFDLLHDGHIDILKQAKEQCEFLIVAVGNDIFMQRRKGRQSTLSYEQRVKIVESIRYVDMVVEAENLDKISAYKKYKFDVMFAGEDHLNEKIYIEATKELKELGVDTIFVPRRIKVSSTDIRERIINECKYE